VTFTYSDEVKRQLSWVPRTCLLCDQTIPFDDRRGWQHDCPGGHLRASCKGDAGGWQGVIRHGRRVVATCGHRHRNRDQSTWTNGTAATSRAKQLLTALRWGEQELKQQHREYRGTGQGWSRDPGTAWALAEFEQITRYAAEIRDSVKAQFTGRPQCAPSSSRPACRR
jgi:hypothetical protein